MGLELMQARMKFPPASEEWREANGKLEKVSHEKRKRVPDERHRQRMSALYVEPRIWRLVEPTGKNDHTRIFARFRVRCC